MRITDSERTQGSARLFLSKLFKNLKVKDIEKEFHTLPRKEDFMMYLTEKNCKLYRHLVLMIHKSEPFKLLMEFKDYILQNYLMLVKQNIHDGVKTMVIN